ncbi:LysR family transcriptional regulator [Microbacterium karelineae]|uniref:LysR family transcriptional regulator n=1 Tax=Microbacterium karelineae TaxID=2654283 RepID=UPI0012E9B47C|nr:LysR family transcriptional regulator [Microbacterium karelineae]
MDVRQLEFVLAIAEEGSFTRAAERSFVSQPGLSSSIRSLERELGVPLFERGRRGAQLTPAGARFLPRAERILDDVREAQRALAGGAPRGLAVRIGAEQCFGGLVDIADLMTTFAERHPAADLEFVQDTSSRLAPLVDSGRLDVALVARGSDSPSSEGTLLRREPFVLLSDPGDASPHPASLDDLDGARLVDFGPTWEARRVLDRALAERGIERRTVVEVGDVHMLLSLIGRGFGRAVVPESIAAKQAASELAVSPLVGAPEWEIHAALCADPTPLAEAFAAMLMPYAAVTALREELVTVA